MVCGAILGAGACGYLGFEFAGGFGPTPPLSERLGDAVFSGLFGASVGGFGFLVLQVACEGLILLLLDVVAWIVRGLACLTGRKGRRVTPM
jgi:hypothetical protein